MAAICDKNFQLDMEIKLSKTAIEVGAQCRLTLADAKLLAKKSLPVRLHRNSHAPMAKSYRFLQSCINQRIAIYGINTHFGDQVSLIDPYIHNNTVTPEQYHDSINSRQENLIRSHSCGLGNIIPAEIIRVAMMLRAHCLGQGFSGVTPHTVQAILDYLNSGIVPIVRTYGSIGASGDLIPLAMIAAGIIGEEVDVIYRGERMRAPKAIAIAGLDRMKPQGRDGLAMINDTSFMTSIASLALYDLKRLFKQMLCAIGMSLESMLVIESSFNPLVHQLKRHSGENYVNQFLLNFWEESKLLTCLDELRELNKTSQSTPTSDSIKRVQDYYSLRSVSQGFGPFFENLERATLWIENEMNSINDNPIIDSENQKIHHSANFMGYYVTDTCDILKMDIAQASSWIHALIANMVHPRKNYQLPANLVPDPSKQNGFRPIQLLTAALAIQNRKLAQAHQAYMLPTEGDNQDVNSLGTHAAIDFREAVNNLERLTAVLLLAATQALEFRGLEKASPRSQAIHHLIRQYSPPLGDCRPMSEDIESIVHLLEEERL